MECNREEAMRAKIMADEMLEKKNFAAAKKYVLRAQSLYPNLEGLSQMLTTIGIYVSAMNKVGGEMDWYGVLGIKPSDDDETLKKQYKKMALALHPDKNKSAGADGAFKLLCEGWSCLSDKSKRLAYDQRRFTGVGFQRNVSMNTSSSTAPPRKNGFHKTTAASKSHQTNTRTHPASVPTTTRSDTFWTICHKCKMHYEYMKQFLNHTLLCPNCQQAFLATETPPPFNHSKTSGSSSQHRQNQNQYNHASASNRFPPGRNPSTANGLGSGDARARTSNYVHLQDPHYRAGGTDPAISAKAANVVQQAHERMKRERDASNGAGGYYNYTYAGKEGLYKKARLDENVTNMAAYNGTTKGLYPGFYTAYNKPTGTSDLTPIETENMLMEKARRAIVEKLIQWRSPAASNKKSRKVNGITSQKHDSNGTLKSSGTACMVNQTENVDANGTEDPMASSMDVPDPDFHNFDGDRSENSFGENQVWACYDNDDGMPRVYAMVNKVISRKPFKVRINWLNSKTNTEFGPMNWVGSGFYKACGEFRYGRHEINTSINSFSHKVQWSKAPRGAVHIFPQKGEIWALYRHWAPDWNEHTPDEVIHKYDLIIVLDDYNEDDGVSVAPLLKVAGFTTLFIPHPEPEKVMRIGREEMFRFSHQIARCKLTGYEAPNVPKKCLELDPASTPYEFLRVMSEKSNPAPDSA